MVKPCCKYYVPDMVEKLQKEENIAVFGARIVAVEVASVLMGEPYNLSITSFVVSQTEDNPSELFEKPVISLDEARDILAKDILIIIACMEKNLNIIIQSLQHAGFFHLLPLTFESDLWCNLRGNYFMEYCSKNHKQFLKLEDELLNVDDRQNIENEWSPADILSIRDEDKKKGVFVYSAKCHVDKKLDEDTSVFSWEIPIQVGAKLTQQIICNIRDDIGENISDRNREYCELTALYWIWKNTYSQYAGLCHYRRHFQLNSQQICQITMSDIDVILTIPILNFPSVGAVYAQDHDINDWKIMMQAINKIHPEYLDAANNVQNGIYYYAYNMFIAKKTIFDEYCQWLFPILEYCEKNCKKKESVYQNRYIGFLAERLLTIYIRYHEKQYKIVHAKKHFIDK